MMWTLLMESTSFTNSARGMRPMGFAEHKSPAASPYFQKRRLRCGSNSHYFPIKSTFWCSLTSTEHAWEGSLSSMGRGKSQETLHTGRFHQSLQLTYQFQCPFKNLLMHQCSVGGKKSLSKVCYVTHPKAIYSFSPKVQNPNSAQVAKCTTSKSNSG